MIHQPSPKVIRAAPIGASGPCTIYRRISRFFRPEIPSAQARTGIAKLWFQSRLLTRKKLGSIPKCNRMTHRPHSVKVEAQVVNRVQNLSQYFVRCIEMPKISSRVPGTNTAAAVRIEWASVSSVACLLDRHFSFRRKQQTMPRRPSGQNTIHHVDTKIGVFDNLFRCTHTHKIEGGVLTRPAARSSVSVALASRRQSAPGQPGAAVPTWPLPDGTSCLCNSK